MTGKKTNNESAPCPGNAAGNQVFEVSAKVVVVGPDGKVLILTRSENEHDNQGKRDLPGGSVELGETVGDAAAREVLEETGLSVSGIVPLPVYSTRTCPDGSLQRIRFVAFADSSDVTLDPDEHSAFEWLTFDQALATLEADGYEADKRESVLRAKEYLELRDGLDGWKRCLADFDNYRKRQEASQKDMGRFLVERFVLDLVPVLDNFHAAAEHVPAEAKDSPWVTGLGYIGKQFEDVLSQNGVTLIEPKEGDAFDPSKHEAISHEGTSDDAADGAGQVIAKVLRKGYAMGDKVISAAKVAVR